MPNKSNTVAPKGDPEKYTVLSFEDDKARAIESVERTAANLTAARQLEGRLLDEQSDPDPRVAFVAEGAAAMVRQRIENLSRAINTQRQNLGRFDVDLSLAEHVAGILADAVSDAEVFVTIKVPDRITEGVQLFVVAEGDVQRRQLRVRLDDGTFEDRDELQGRFSVVLSAPDTRRELDVKWFDRALLNHGVVTSGDGQWMTYASNSGDRFQQTLSLAFGEVVRVSQTTAAVFLEREREAYERGLTGSVA